MKHINIFFSALFIFLSIVIKPLHAQESMDFEEFMGMMSETMTDEQLDELSYQLPWDITVLGYGYGEFSGDEYDDIAISIREKGVTPNNSVDVYFFKNVDNKTYQLIKKKNYKYFELTLEVAFLVKDGKCFVTNRDNSNWYFTAYEIDEDSLKLVTKEVFPIEFEKAGE